MAQGPTALVIIIVVIALVFGFVAYAVRNDAKKKLDLLRHGDAREAEVITVTQLSAPGDSGGNPTLKLLLSLSAPDGTPTQATYTGEVDYANIPRPGDRVYVTVDRRDSTKMLYNGLAANYLRPTQAYPIDFEALQRAGIAICTVRSITGGSPVHITAEIDSTVDPKRTVTFSQPSLDYTPTPGERIYIYVSGAGDVTAVPLYLTGGRRLTPAGNRLDPLVLGPQILLRGKQAVGTVLAAERIWTSGAFARDAGIQRWHLKFRVAPLDQSPAYDAEQDLSFSTPERAAELCRPGAQAALRVDWNDPLTIATDSIAEGRPNPYPSVIARWNKAVAEGKADQL